jgi:hypothetical protein
LKNKHSKGGFLVSKNSSPSGLLLFFFEGFTMLILTRMAFLQQIQRLAASGYFFYKSEVIHADKLASATKAFKEKYKVNPTSQQAWRAKLKGKASAHLLIYPNLDEYESQDFVYVLMVSAGEHPAHDNETLLDLRKRSERLSIIGYELIQKPDPRGKQSFTFRMNNDVYGTLRTQLIQAIRHKNEHELIEVVRKINYITSFNGIKQQKRSLRVVLHREYEKRYGWKLPKHDYFKINLNFSKAVKVEYVKNVASFIEKMKENQLTALQMLKRHKTNAKKRGDAV